MEKIVVLGGGESGYGSAVLAKVKGFDIFVSDMGTIAPRYAAILDRYGIPYEQGGHTPERIFDAAVHMVDQFPTLKKYIKNMGLF